jgi:hypothetical protein
MIGGILYQAFPMWLSVPLPWGGYAMDADIEISLSVHLILYILFLSQIARLRWQSKNKRGHILANAATFVYKCLKNAAL